MSWFEKISLLEKILFIVFDILLIIYFRKNIICFFVGHKWTSKSQQGIKPTESEIQKGVIGFYEYAKPFCFRCGKRMKN